MTILFLHGKEGLPGGTKPTFLRANGFTVFDPLLPSDDFTEAVRVAQAAFDEHKPSVVVGSSRGGAVAMNINSGDAGLVLLCPAWKKAKAAVTTKANTLVLHSKTDIIIPFADSEELIRNSSLSNQMLIPIGVDHRLSTEDALSTMLDAVRLWTPTALDAPQTYGDKVTPADRAELDIIHAELAQPGLSADRREELEWALSAYGDKYCFDWLADELGDETPKA